MITEVVEVRAAASLMAFSPLRSATVLDRSVLRKACRRAASVYSALAARKRALAVRLLCASRARPRNAVKSCSSVAIQSAPPATVARSLYRSLRSVAGSASASSGRYRDVVARHAWRQRRQLPRLECPRVLERYGVDGRAPKRATLDVVALEAVVRLAHEETRPVQIFDGRLAGRRFLLRAVILSSRLSGCARRGRRGTLAGGRQRERRPSGVPHHPRRDLVEVPLR
jgi:hypothetical protein